ncbi:MAG: hypothetical protein AAGE98_15815 [Actinomycetota bacterium]
MTTTQTTTMHTTAPSTILLRLVVAMATFVAGMATALVIDMDPTAARGQMADFIVVDHGPARLVVDANLDLTVETITGGDDAPAPDPEPARETAPERQTELTRDTDESKVHTAVLVITPDLGGDDKSASDTLGTGNQCPGSGALPEGATNHTLAGADVDGDGDVDTLHGFVLDGQGYVQVSFTGGGGSALAVDPGFAPMVAPRPSEGHDLDLDGRDEFTARIAGGVGGFTHGLFQVDSCTLTAVTLDGGSVELHQRETIGARSGFMCTHEEGNSFLHVWSLELLDPEDLDEPQDGDVYAGPRSMYRLIDGELVLQGVSEAFEIPGEYELGQFSSCSALHP